MPESRKAKTTRDEINKLAGPKALARGFRVRRRVYEIALETMPSSDDIEKEPVIAAWKRSIEKNYTERYGNPALFLIAVVISAIVQAIVKWLLERWTVPAAGHARLRNHAREYGCFPYPEP